MLKLKREPPLQKMHTTRQRTLLKKEKKPYADTTLDSSTVEPVLWKSSIKGTPFQGDRKF